MRDLLIKQIAEELVSGESQTLNGIVDKIDDKQILARLNKINQQIVEDRKPNFELKGGMRIRAKVDTNGVSNSFNTPERIDIPKGTILELPSQGTSRGDVFCKVVEGECIVHCRHPYGYVGEPTRAINAGSGGVGLVGGVKTRCPWDLGVADKNIWEIVR